MKAFTNYAFPNVNSDFLRSYRDNVVNKPGVIGTYVYYEGIVVFTVSITYADTLQIITPLWA